MWTRRYELKIYCLVVMGFSEWYRIAIFFPIVRIRPEASLDKALPRSLPFDLHADTKITYKKHLALISYIKIEEIDMEP